MEGGYRTECRQSEYLQPGGHQVFHRTDIAQCQPKQARHAQLEQEHQADFSQLCQQSAHQSLCSRMHTVADAAVLGKPAAPTRPDTQRGTEPAVVRSQQADLAQGVDRSVCSRTDYQLLCLQQPARQLGRRPVHRLARQSPHTQELLYLHHRCRRPADDHSPGAAVAGQGVVADAAHRWHIDRLRGCGRISHHHSRHGGHLREQGRCRRRRHHGHHHLRPRGQRAHTDQRHHHLRQYTH